MFGAHHHGGPPAGPGGPRPLSVSAAYLGVQRGPLHHLLRQRPVLQLQHQREAAGTDGGQ